MAKEIERKFLVCNDDWRQDREGTLIRQGYLAMDDRMAIRVRVAGRKATLNIKSVQEDLVNRDEYEYPIPLEDAQAMLEHLCQRRLVEKRRYTFACEGMTWEVDEFAGANTGLVLAEIELDSADQAFTKPGWLGREVSHDPRFLNSNLSVHPYATW